MMIHCLFGLCFSNNKKEMAERHDAKAVLNIARDLVHQIQTLMENDK